MSIKRYTPSGVHHTSVYLGLDTEGAVVMYDDHVAEVERLKARVRELETVLMSVVGNVIEAIRELAPENPAVAALCDAYAKDLAAVSAEKEDDT